jgi:hypothetical protein
MTGQPDIAAALAWSGEAARAAANAQAALRGEPVPALLISSEAHLAGAEASPANPYGSSKHGRFDAASAAEVAQGAEPAGHSCDDSRAWGLCWAKTPTRNGHSTVGCTLPAGHDGDHVAHGTGNPPGSWAAEGGGIDWDALKRVQGFAQGLCPAQWGEPPETMLCSLPSGHDGNHATAEGIEWAGKWETAEPGDVTR